jgi:hypothetical protein
VVLFGALAIRDMACFVEMLCGAMRTHIQTLDEQSQEGAARSHRTSKNKSKGKGKGKSKSVTGGGLPGLTKAQRQELHRGTEMLLVAMRPQCVTLNAPEGSPSAKVVGSNALAAANALSRLVTPNVSIPFGDDEGFLRSPLWGSESTDGSESHNEGTRRMERYARYLSASAELYLHLAN